MWLKIRSRIPLSQLAMAALVGVMGGMYIFGPYFLKPTALPDSTKEATINSSTDFQGMDGVDSKD